MSRAPAHTSPSGSEPPTIVPTDADLVRAVRLDSRSGPVASRAFGELVRRHERGVYALALSLLHDPAEAEDMTQEAFLRAFTNLDLLADPGKFGVWVGRIAFGVTVDWLRAFRPRLYQPMHDRAAGNAWERTDTRVDGSVALEPADTAPSPLEELERAEVASRVLAALDRLPERYRVPFTLFHVDGLSHAKVARALGAPEGTVRSLVARARRKLTTLLADEVQVMGGAPDTRTSLDALAEPPGAPRFMHVLNGDVVGAGLERSDVGGTLAVWADILHEGPIPRDSGTASWRAERARYIAACGYADAEEALRRYEEWDARLERFAEHDEVVLWFEHDLFDQLLLVRHLAWFSRRDLGATRLSLICIGEFPGFARFDGLGQLGPDQLASLLGTREVVSPEQLKLGRRVWDAFTADDPTSLAAIHDSLETSRSAGVTRDARGVGSPGDRWSESALLPFLPGALGRFLEEYPSVTGGLPRTERQILECLVDPMSPKDLFHAAAAREERVFMGDWTFWTRVRQLAGGAAPLVRIDVEAPAGPGLPDGLVAITDAGRAVLAGDADWVRLNGMDRWLGGVHLVAPAGADVRWRYQPDDRSLRRARESPGITGGGGD